MKKKIMITISVIAVTTALGLGIYHSNAANTASILNEEDIRELVQSHYPGTITEFELEKKNGKAVYEIEIEGEDAEYELNLDASTGEVLKLEEKVIKTEKNKERKKEVVIGEEADDDHDDVSSRDHSEEQSNRESNQDADDKSDEQEEETNDNKQRKNSKTAIIDIATAEEIALAEFDGIVTEIELDEEDGRLIYEIEIESRSGEAEFEIDAYTGEVLVISIDSDFDDDDDDNDDNDDNND